MSKEYARHAKNFLLQNSSGVLSTHSAKYAGFPFGSVVPYDVREDGTIIIFISSLASHFKNLSKDPKACLTIRDRFGGSDPQAHSRLSLLLEFRQASDSDREKLSASYFNRFEFARQYEGFHDFFFYVAEIRYLRWIAGFGEMGWITAEDFLGAPWDAVAYTALPAIEHMNEDHQDALEDFARAYGKGMKDAMNLTVWMTSLDSFGFLLEVHHEEQTHQVSIPFKNPLQSSAQVRPAIIELLKECRESLAH